MVQQRSLCAVEQWMCIIRVLLGGVDIENLACAPYSEGIKQFVKSGPAATKPSSIDAGVKAL